MKNHIVPPTGTVAANAAPNDIDTPAGTPGNRNMYAVPLGIWSTTVDGTGVDVKVESLTGAGDVFAAAFFLKAADKSVSAREAGMFANAIAALSLRDIGVGSVPPISEVEKLLEEL